MQPQCLHITHVNVIKLPAKFLVCYGGCSLIPKVNPQATVYFLQMQPSPFCLDPQTNQPTDIITSQMIYYRGGEPERAMHC